MQNCMVFDIIDVLFFDGIYLCKYLVKEMWTVVRIFNAVPQVTGSCLCGASCF